MFCRQRQPSETNTNAITQAGRVRKWGAMENRKQKQTANTLERLDISWEIDWYGRFRLVIVIRIKRLIQIGLPEHGQRLQAGMFVRVSIVLFDRNTG